MERRQQILDLVAKIETDLYPKIVANAKMLDGENTQVNPRKVFLEDAGAWLGDFELTDDHELARIAIDWIKWQVLCPHHEIALVDVASYGAPGHGQTGRCPIDNKQWDIFGNTIVEAGDPYILGEGDVR